MSPYAPWPWPGDTTRDRARRIANSLLSLVPEQQRDAIVSQAHRYGETWLGHDEVTADPDSYVSGADAADLVAVSPATIRQWAATEHPGVPGRMLLPRGPFRQRERTYLVRDVLSAAGTVRRARHAKRANSSPV